jgi:nicotinamidase-related amidase
MRKGKLFILMAAACAITMVAAIAGCGCGGSDKSVISSISPSSGEQGTEVTLSGSSFGDTQGNSTVEFGTVTATVEEWSDVKVKTKVPTDMKTGEYKVTVTTDAGTSDGVGFEVKEEKKSEVSDRKTGHVEHNTPTAAILDYCKKNGINSSGMTFSVLVVSASDPNWKIDLGKKVGHEAESMQFLLHKDGGKWTVIESSSDGWTAAQLKALGAPEDLVTQPPPQPVVDQAQAILTYLQSKGEPTSGWTFTLLKVSMIDSNWEVIKGTMSPDGRTEEFLLIFNEAQAGKKGVLMKTGSDGELLVKNDTVLVVVDMQEKLLPVIHEEAKIIENVVKLVRFADIIDIPILVTEQEKLGPTVEAIRSEIPGFSPIIKIDFDACRCSAFAGAFQQLNRSTVIITGIESHVCVTQTVLHLLEDAKVHVISDAISSRTPENREVAIRRMSRSGAVISSTEMAIFELLAKAGTPEFKEALGIVK